MKVHLLYNTPQERKSLLEVNMSEVDVVHPDYYFDRVEVTVTIFGANITFSLGKAHPKNEAEATEIKALATVRTSLEHAKIFAMLLRKQLKTYELNTHIDIRVPSEVYERLGLDANDW
jgi:hypothetical protein